MTDSARLAGVGAGRQAGGAEWGRVGRAGAGRSLAEEPKQKIFSALSAALYLSARKPRVIRGAHINDHHASSARDGKVRSGKLTNCFLEGNTTQSTGRIRTKFTENCLQVSRAQSGDEVPHARGFAAGSLFLLFPRANNALCLHGDRERVLQVLQPDFKSELNQARPEAS